MLTQDYLPMVLVPGAYVARKFWAKTSIIRSWRLTVSPASSLIPLTPVRTGARTKADIELEVDDAPKGIWGYVHRFLF